MSHVCVGCGEELPGVGGRINVCPTCLGSDRRKIYQIFHRDCGPTSKIELFDAGDSRIEPRCSVCGASWELSGLGPYGPINLDARSGLASVRGVIEEGSG